EPIQQLREAGVTRVVHYADAMARYAAQLLPFLCLGRPESVHAAREDVRFALTLFEDEPSRGEFVRQVARPLYTGFVPPIPASARARQSEYFPSDVYRALEDEVFVDCGAFDGDTMRRLIALRGGQFARAHLVEPDAATFARLRAWVGALPNEVRERIATY